MANENNNINELVADDDDPTVELEISMFRRRAGEADQDSADTTGSYEMQIASAEDLAKLESDLHTRDEAIARLQFDIEQLQTKYLELKTEAATRDTQAKQLNDELASTKDGVSRKEKLLKKRDSKIKSLKSEIRQRDDEQRKLAIRYEDLQRDVEARDRQFDESCASPPVDDTYSVGELKLRLERSNEYADAMRRQLQDLIETHAAAEREIDHLSLALETSTRKNLDLVDEKARLASQLEDQQARLDSAQSQHDEEIRLLRFELGEAQDTVVESEVLNSQLASDLVDAQGFKVTLEQMLAQAEEESGNKLAKSQQENAKLKRRNKNFERKLAAKSEAITALLAELAKKTEQIENIGQLDDTFLDIDGSGKHTRADGERVTRALVGIVEDQLLQFPLFKDRLTIGRTKDNDIQLTAAYVSRRHAVVQTDGETARIIDWGSKNGINVNSKKIDEHVLKHGDIIMIGNARFRFEEHKKREA